MRRRIPGYSLPKIDIKSYQTLHIYYDNNGNLANKYKITTNYFRLIATKLKIVKNFIKDIYEKKR